MFKGGKEKSNPESPDRLNRIVSGTQLTGDLIANSSLRVDGEIVGNIHCEGKLVLGEEGHIRGDIKANEVELNGTVEGQITVEALLVLHQTAIVKGDAVTGRVVIEDGAQIEGNMKTGEASKRSKKVKKKAKNKAPQEEKVTEPVY